MVARLSPTKILWPLIFLTPLLLILSLAVGPVEIPLDLFFELWSPLRSGDEALLAGSRTVVIDIRLPRVLLAWLVGAGLALSGAAMQGLFRNPLADPSIVGVTSGASLGASVALVVGGVSAGQFGGLSLLVLGAFLGGVLAVALVYRLATSSSGTSVATMLLVGIAITAVAAAGNSLLAYFSDDETLRRISLWNMGGLDAANAVRVGVAALVILPAMLAILRYGRSLDILLLGESEARHLGVDVQRLKWVLVLWVAVTVATAVALAGVIGFVGLIVPHLLRLLMGPRHAGLFPCCIFAGGALLLLADSLARTLVSPAELPVGVLTALLGAPLFVSLLRRRHEYGML